FDLSFSSCCSTHLHLHSFPTRRSSDLFWEVGFEAPRVLARRDHDLLRAELRARRGRGPPGRLRLFAERRGARHHPASAPAFARRDRKSTRLNSSHVKISYAVFCLKKKV